VQKLTDSANGSARSILPSVHKTVTHVALAITITLSAVAGSAQDSPKLRGVRGSHKRAAVPTAAPSTPPVEAPPPPPPPPLTPEQMPPSPPQISWDGEQLTINSDNSTLADILNAVRRLTGADIDVSGGASAERVAARLGPGPAREVLSSLLGGTDFNYIIQASDENPLGIQSILLTPRAKGNALPGNKSAIVAAMRRPDTTPPVESGNLRAPEMTEPTTEATNTSGKIPTEPASNGETHTASAVPPGSSDSKAANPDPQSAATEALPVQADLTPPPAPSESDANRPKTIQDKIQDMQGMFEQRRQMIEQARKPQGAN